MKRLVIVIAISIFSTIASSCENSLNDINLNKNIINVNNENIEIVYVLKK